MMSSLRLVLLVEPDQDSREKIAAALRQEIGCVVFEAGNRDEAIAIFEERDINLLLTNVDLPKISGVDLLKEVCSKYPHIVTVAAIPYDRRDMIVAVAKCGAFQSVFLPYEPTETVIAVAKGLRLSDAQTNRPKQGSKIRKSESFYGMVGVSREIQSVFRVVEKVAEDGLSTVLINGESGTGKELVARAIHTHSSRSAKNFVPVNCAAIPENLLESELFGYVKGAFTGAGQSKVGRIQYADGGTLFLDEIGDMRQDLQAKLLRVLQEREFEPVGAVKPVPVDVRVVAATHRDLEKLVADGGFREDLYYRLNVIPIEIPPLRERPSDVPPLLQKFVQVYNRERREPLQGFSDAATKVLMHYAWPGNIRELENVVQQMSVLFGGKTVGVENLPARISGQAGVDLEELAGSDMSVDAGAGLLDEQELWKEGAIDFNQVVCELEDRLILEALRRAGGNKKEASRLLNLKRTTLSEKIKKRQLEEMFEV